MNKYIHFHFNGVDVPSIYLVSMQRLWPRYSPFFFQNSNLKEKLNQKKVKKMASEESTHQADLQICKS